METKAIAMVSAARIASILAVLALTNIAFAYPVGGPVPSQTLPTAGSTSQFDFGGSLKSLASPFQNFFTNIQGVGNATFHPVVPESVTSGTPPSDAPSTMLQGWWKAFDDWVDAKTGFRPSGFLGAILGIFSWLLGLVKGIVDWLLWLVR